MEFNSANSATGNISLTFLSLKKIQYAVFIVFFSVLFSFCVCVCKHCDCDKQIPGRAFVSTFRNQKDNCIMWY